MAVGWKSGIEGILLVVAAVTPLFAQSVRTHYAFNVNGSAEGWTSANATVSVAEGLLSGVATTSDPQMLRSGLSFPGSASSGVHVRLRASVNGAMDLFWGRLGADYYAAERRIRITYSGDGEFQTLFIAANGHSQWNENTVTKIRLDPPGGTGATFAVDWIEILSWDYDNDGWLDTVEGSGDDDGDGTPNFRDPDSRSEGISDKWRRAIANAPGSVHFNFDTPGNLEGWHTNSTLRIEDHASGVVTAVGAGANPQLYRTGLYLQSGLVDAILVRVSTPANGSMRLYWGHSQNNVFVAGRSTDITVSSNDGRAQTVYVDLTQAPEWKGYTITRLRLDFAFPVGVPFEIDWIRTSDGDYDRDGIPDLVEGTDDIDDDGLANFEDPDSNGDGVPDHVALKLGWDPYAPISLAIDTDGDGASDAQELVAGTDPNSASDAPRLQFAVADGTNMSFAMEGRDGRSYTLQIATNLLSGHWTNAETRWHARGGEEIAWDQPIEPTAGARFFRAHIYRTMDDPMVYAPSNSPTRLMGTHENAVIDNGTIRLQSSFANGGSITHFEVNGGPNFVNIHDQGRLIQQSYYAGENLDRRAEGQSSSWSPWPWNPIQGGDAALNAAEVLDVTAAEFGGGAFTRTVPLLWDMTTGEKGQALMDQWNQFEPGMSNVVRVTCRFMSLRDENDQWGVRSRHQELPATYFIRSFSKVVSYTNSAPWTLGATSQLTYAPGPPWFRGYPSEDWIAMVNPATDTGVGLYSPISDGFWWYGATGNPPGGPTSSQTMHMAPISTIRLEHKSILAYRYWLIYGHLEEIRRTVYALRARYPHG